MSPVPREKNFKLGGGDRTFARKREEGTGGGKSCNSKGEKNEPLCKRKKRPPEKGPAPDV